MSHEWSPADLPSDFKLFEWDFARNDQITLDSDSKIASIADNWQNRLVKTAPNSLRRSINSLNGVQAAYAPDGNGGAGSGHIGSLLLADNSGLPSGNEDRYVGIAAYPTYGLIGGYRGSSSDNNIYCIDSLNSSNYSRFYYGNNRGTGSVAFDPSIAHFYTFQHSNSVTNVRIGGVDTGSYNAVLNTVVEDFGIAGCQSNYYAMQGYTFYAIVGKRAPTQDERWRIEAWVAKYKTKQTPPNDNPYANALPYVSDANDTPNVTPDPAAQTQVGGTSSLVGSKSLTSPAGVTQAQYGDSATIRSRESLVPTQGTQTQDSKTASLSGVRSLLAPIASSQAQSSEASAIRVNGMLSANYATQQQRAGNAALEVRGYIAAVDAMQKQYLDIAFITVGYNIMPYPSTQKQSLVPPILSARVLLAPNFGLQKQFSDYVLFLSGFTIDPRRIIISHSNYRIISSVSRQRIIG